ncbi:MAG: TRAP transporter small permease [Spirochaetales bacterium]|jgi:TRAP-type C4-dicarboxylate transport system permease small subunit|nr:TRAP transporter small permease [Spirochaetales bacterium]
MENLIHIVYDWIIEIWVRIIGIVMLTCILLQIFTRAFFKLPFPWTDELARFAFIWFCLMGSVMTMRRNLHLGIDYFESKMSPRVKRYNRIGIQSLIIVFGLFIGIFGIQLLGIVKVQTSVVMRMPMTWVYVALPTAGFLYALLGVNGLALYLKGKKEGSV